MADVGHKLTRVEHNVQAMCRLLAMSLQSHQSIAGMIRRMSEQMGLDVPTIGSLPLGPHTDQRIMDMIIFYETTFPCHEPSSLFAPPPQPIVPPVPQVAEPEIPPDQPSSSTVVPSTTLSLEDQSGSSSSSSEQAAHAGEESNDETEPES